MKTQFLILFLTCSIIISCTPQISKSIKFEESKSSIKTVAIIPYRVILDMKPFPKGMDDKDLRDYEEKTGYEAQEASYAWFVQNKNRFSVEFQDVKKTNELIVAGKENLRKMQLLDKGKLCKYLGVDAILSGKLVMTKPMSTGAAFANDLFGAQSSSNMVGSTLSIEDASNETLWKYDMSEAIGFSANLKTWMPLMLKKANKKFPYQKK